jgi:diguanylate cyclase (GGDEF)-like protein
MKPNFEKKSNNESEIILGLQKKLEEAQEKIRKLTEERHVDLLTGLRLDAESELDKLIEELNNHSGGPLSSIVVVYLDLDKFKQINDSYGHAVGDQAILVFVDKLQSLIKRTDTIFRLHGDEFAVIMPVGKDLTEQEMIELFQRLHDGVNKFNMPIDSVDKKTIALSASIGYAVLNKKDKIMTAKALLKKADDSMYKAKENKN